MHRRTFLRVSLPAVAGVLAGCYSPSPYLEIQNEKTKQVALDVVLYRWRGSREDEEYNEIVSIPASVTKRLKVFHRSTYTVQIEYDGLTAEFQTAPVCRSAETMVTLHENGGISWELDWCEHGPPGGAVRPTDTLGK